MDCQTGREHCTVFYVLCYDKMNALPHPKKAMISFSYVAWEWDYISDNHLRPQSLTFRVQGACGFEDLLGDEGHKLTNGIMVTVVMVIITIVIVVMVIVHCVSVNVEITIRTGGEEKGPDGGK